jgi:hypothetical protein
MAIGNRRNTDNALHFTESYQAARIGDGLVFS